MNLYTAENTFNGEVLGQIFSYFSIIMITILLPFLSLYILTKTIDQLKDERMKESIGELYEGIKINTKYTLMYTFLLVLRRLIYLTIETFIKDKKLGGI
jgi:hypothetical protein